MVARPVLFRGWVVGGGVDLVGLSVVGGGVNLVGGAVGHEFIGKPASITAELLCRP